MMALSAIETAREDFGLRAGRDLGVAGFDDIEGASWRSFDLTTYSQPTEKMIEQLMRLVLDPVSHFEAPHIIVDGELKVRGSTRRG
jgi:DNA-binding LacI/PurR family transcriptional regulator